MPEATCLNVPKNLGEIAIRLVGELRLLNRKLKIQEVDDDLCIPLTNEPPPAIFQKFEKTFPKFEISILNFPERKKRHFTPLDFLADKMPSNLLANIPRAIDFIGDIAIVELPLKLAEHKKTIGEAVLKSHKHTNTVLAKSGAVGGIYRIREFEVIAGVDKTATVYREYGCMYHVDVAKAYFSPRLSTEHNRVASQIKDGETVVDLFAGVGPFSILIAKKNENVRVYAVDVNPDAIALLKRNIAVNHVGRQVVPLLGNARKVIREKLSRKADRVIMNLPETALEFVDVASETLKLNGGIIHYYGFVKASNPLEIAKVRLAETLRQNNRKVENFLLVKRVREVAPYTCQVVVDAQIQ